MSIALATLLFVPQFTIPKRTAWIASSSSVTPVGSLVCTTSGTANVVSLSLSFAPAQAGDQLLVYMGALAATNLTATDNGGSTYTQVGSGNAGSTDAVISGALSVSGSTTQITETEAGGGTQPMDLCVQEFSGVLQFGNVANGTLGTGTSFSGSLTAHAETGNYVTSLINSAGGITFTATTGTLLGQEDSASGGRGIAVMGGPAPSGAVVTQAGSIGSASHQISQVLVELRAH